MASSRAPMDAPAPNAFLLALVLPRYFLCLKRMPSPFLRTQPRAQTLISLIGCSCLRSSSGGARALGHQSTQDKDISKPYRRHVDEVSGEADVV